MSALSFILFLGFLAGGLALLAVGLHVRRRGDTPHCADCGYNLTGLISNACPECGTAMAPGSIVRGEPYRRRRLAVAGVCLLIVALGWIPILTNMVNGYAILPTRVLIYLAKASEPDPSQDAWKELERRLTAGTLSPTHISLLFTDMVKPTLIPRPVTSPHDPVPVRFLCEVHTGMPIAVGIVSAELKLNGQPFDYEFSTAVEAGSSPVASSATRHLPNVSPGEKRLTGVFHVTFHPTTVPWGGGSRIIRPPLAAMARWPRPYFQHTIPIDITFTVLETEPPDYIRRIRDDALAERLPRYGFIGNLTIERRDGYRCQASAGFYGDVGLGGGHLPLTIATDIVLKIGDREIPHGHIIAGGTPDPSYAFSFLGRQFEYRGKRIETADIILRTNEKYARESIDLDVIWDGEAVIKDVKIDWQEIDTPP